MVNQEQWHHKVFGINANGFEALALEIFRFQAQHNPVYKAYIQALHIDPAGVQVLTDIPFLPIRFFKTHAVRTTEFEPQAIFESSGTSGMTNSKHFVKTLSLYDIGFIKTFELFYGRTDSWCIIGLLPSYLERNNSSLVHMTDRLIAMSEHPQSGFYLDDYEKLTAIISEQEKKQEKTWLIGVSFALLDWAEIFSMELKHTTLVETGGMKGRRKEMIREELHEKLKKAFHVPVIHSEYGMTELLSQAYSKGEGIFNCPPWMKILIRDEEDPFVVKDAGAGTINIIDLANVWSCSFIATDDVGKLNPDGSFEVLGRVDGSDLRGCSLMLV